MHLTTFKSDKKSGQFWSVDQYKKGCKGREIRKEVHIYDELDEQLLDDLENTMRGALAQVKSKAKAESNGQNNSDEPVKQTVPLVKQETKNVVENQDLKEKELLKKDPFYKFRKMKEENANGRSD